MQKFKFSVFGAILFLLALCTTNTTWAQTIAPTKPDAKGQYLQTLKDNQAKAVQERGNRAAQPRKAQAATTKATTAVKDDAALKAKKAAAMTHAPASNRIEKPFVLSEAEKKAAAEKMAKEQSNNNERPMLSVMTEAEKRAAAEKIAKEQSNNSEKPILSVMTEAEKRAAAEKIAKEQSRMLANQEVPATTVNTNSPFPIVAKAIDKSKVVNANATKANPTNPSQKLQSDEK